MKTEQHEERRRNEKNKTVHPLVHTIKPKGALPGPSSVTELPFYFINLSAKWVAFAGQQEKDVHSAARCHGQRSKNHTPSRIARKIRLDRVNSPKYCFFPCGSSRAICR